MLRVEVACRGLPDCNFNRQRSVRPDAGATVGQEASCAAVDNDRLQYQDTTRDLNVLWDN